MKLPLKVAGLCWSVTFLVTALPGFYQRTRPTDFASISTESFSGMEIVETLSISLIGSLAAAMIGYMIGDILARPQGMGKGVKKGKAQSTPVLVDQKPEASPTPETIAEAEPEDTTTPEEAVEPDVKQPPADTES